MNHHLNPIKSHFFASVAGPEKYYFFRTSRKPCLLSVVTPTSLLGRLERTKAKRVS